MGAKAKSALNSFMYHSDQMSLDLAGMPIKRKGKNLPKHGQALYFAALPTSEVAKLTAEMTWDQSRRNGLRREPRQYDLYHTTIYPLDIAHRAREEAIVAAMDAASTIYMSSFELVYDRVATFGGRGNHQYVLWRRRGNEELKMLRRELCTALQCAGFDTEAAEPYEPHMTLFYCGRVLPESMLARPVRWIVRSLMLVNSFQGDSEHGHIWEWPLS